MQSFPEKRLCLVNENGFINVFLLLSRNNISPIDGSCNKIIESLILKEIFSPVSNVTHAINAEKMLKLR